MVYSEIYKVKLGFMPVSVDIEAILGRKKKICEKKLKKMKKIKKNEKNKK
jgi:hypothetical protein